MNVFIRFGTLKMVAGFGAICIMFAAGLSLSSLINPRQAEMSAMKRAAAVQEAAPAAAQGAEGEQTAGDAQDGDGAKAAGEDGTAAPADEGQAADGSQGQGIQPAASLGLEQKEEPMTEAKLVLNETAAAEDSLAAYRIDRWRVRSQRTTFLEAVAQDTTIAEAERARARQSLWEEYNRREKELACEEAMVSKGFGPVLVSIDESSRLTALVPTVTFTDEELVQISDILCRLGGCREEDIILIPLSN